MQNMMAVFKIPRYIISQWWMEMLNLWACTSLMQGPNNYVLNTSFLLFFVCLFVLVLVNRFYTLGPFPSSDFCRSNNLLNLRSNIHLCSCLSNMQKFLSVLLTIQHLLPQVILTRKAPPSSSPLTWWKFSCSSSHKQTCWKRKHLYTPA